MLFWKKLSVNSNRSYKYITKGVSMVYQVILETVWSVIYEGSKEECELILKAFKRYNGAKNISIHEKEEA